MGTGFTRTATVVGLVAVFLVLANGCATILLAEPAAPLTLVENGVARATIVIPDDANPWTKMAAGWVQEYVEKSSGAKLAILTEGKAPEGALIAVGHTTLAANAGVNADDLDNDGCKMVVKGNTLFLLGRDTKGCTPAPNAGKGHVVVREGNPPPLRRHGRAGHLPRRDVVPRRDLRRAMAHALPAGNQHS